MKRINLILIGIVLVLVSFQTKAQQDTTILSNLDTVIIFHPQQLNGCIMDYDTNHIPNTNQSYFNYYQESRYPLIDSNGNWTNIFKVEGPIIGKNEYHTEGYAQPYHFDSIVNIIGVEARARGSIVAVSEDGVSDYIDTSYHFRLLDDKMREIAVSINCIIPVTSRYSSYTFYGFGAGHSLHDFYIAADVPTINYSFMGPALGYDYTCSIFDTIWQDTIIGCQSDDSPLFKKNGVWIRFADDSVYNFYQKTFIEFLPVLLIPHNMSGLSDIDVENMCYIYPNPASNELVIQSDFKVKDIIIFDILGRKVMGKEINGYEKHLDISSLPNGDYTIRLNTAKGIVNKKFIKQ